MLCIIFDSDLVKKNLAFFPKNHKRQFMSNKDEPNPTLFFRPFPNTSEGMDADLGFSVSS